MADLQELLSRLKSPNAPAQEGNGTHAVSGTANGSSNAQFQYHHQQPSIWAQPQTQTQYHQPSVSSPIFSPPAQTPNPHHASAIMSPNVNTPVPDARANNLLNLLKFNANQQQQQQQPAQQSPLASLQNVAAAATAGRGPSMGYSPAAHQVGERDQSRVVSASDLVASFQPKQPAQTAASFRSNLPASQVDMKQERVNSPPGDTQNFLLNLLTRPKQPTASPAPQVQAPAPQAPPASVDDLVKSLAETSVKTTAAGDGHAEANTDARESTPVRKFGSANSRETTPFEAPSVAKKGPVFTYVNPFDQLSASSPRRTTPKPESRSATPKLDMLKHQRDVSASVDSDSGAPKSKTRKLVSTADTPVPTTEVPPETEAEVKAEPAAETKQQSVSEVLSGVGEKVDKQVEKALAAAAAADPSPPPLNGNAAGKTNGNDDAEKPKKTTEEVADSWESADAEESPAKGEQGADYVVEVHNFPMKPFVSIVINKTKSGTPIRTQSLMDIARLKKDFEQIDRTLVTASATHILYAMTKAGGVRIIRQDTGKDKKAFQAHQERIFSVQISSGGGGGAKKDVETILATGVNGSSFWAEIPKTEGDAFDELNVEAQGFMLPAVPIQDDNTSGSPVKTRAKMSSRHPDFFAISRGKSIHIISPYVARQNVYADKKTRVVDVERYLKERCLKIHTGKAGKDFAFSEDDSMIVSLDKSGRIKFWDIREMAELAQDSGVGPKRAVELKTPLLTLTTALPMEKATPSSIMFVDKERPCVKGVALRYLIVGLKQNHILQLWDLGLSKPVQEIHFPHEKDSDAICSIAYHPKTGIIALGHPTRNSIYFIHLSAPRYNIQSVDQARFITMLASQDPALARPESTAIMSGIRELSFASKGQLRSVDMLKTPVASETSANVLFELYAMHSKGVTCINIKHEDLGWSSDNKVLKPVDAEPTGYVTVNDMRVAPAPSPSETATEISVKPSKLAAANVSPAQKIEPVKPASVARKLEDALANGSAKIEKPKKTAAAEVPPSAPQATNPAILTPASYAMAAQQAKPPHVDNSTAARTPAAISSEKATPSSKAVTSVDAAKIQDVFAKELESLHRRLDNDKRVYDVTTASNQDAMLRLVSATLTDNVSKELSRIVTDSINTSVLPSVSEMVTSVVDRKLGEVLTYQLSKTIPGHLKQSLPAAISLSMQDKDLHRAISEQASAKIASQAEQAFAAVMKQNIIPQFNNLAVSATQKALAESERRFGEQLRIAESQRRDDAVKLEQLTKLVAGLSRTVEGMAASQTAFQEQILKLQRQLGSSREDTNQSADASAETDVLSSVEDQELQAIHDLMTQGAYEDATIQWLQSPRQGEIFDKLFVRINPEYLRRLSPLVSLSVSAALTSSFDKNVHDRLNWLAAVLSGINLSDPDIRGVAPKIMDILQQRMSGIYMQIAEVDPQDPSLQRISSIVRQISQIKALTE